MNKIGLYQWTKELARIRGKQVGFSNYEFLKRIYRDDSPHIVVMKGAQIGVSELLINTAIWFCETMGGNVLYVMPTQTAMNDFSQARVLPRLGYEETKKHVAKMSLQKIGRGHLYMRGSDSRNQIITVDADLLIRDELDWMTTEHIPMMEERLGASEFKWKRDVSTPTYPDFGIDKAFSASDQHRYLIKCEHCPKEQELDFWENIKYKLNGAGEVVEAKVVCAKCGRSLNRLAKGRWEAAYPSRDVRGYKINRLYSPLTTLDNLILASKKTSESEIQTFYNFTLGISYSPKGGKVGRDLILACRDPEYVMPAAHRGPTTMGVDVGRELNVRISSHEGGERRAVYIGTVKNFEDLDPLMVRFHVACGCVDALPETRKAKEFARRFEGKIRLVYFSTQEELLRLKDSDDGFAEAHCARTQLLDEVAAGFSHAVNILPRNVEEIEDYIKQVTANVRVIQQDAQGRDKAKWIASTPDHYFFAEAYDVLAEKVLYPEGVTGGVIIFPKFSSGRED
ncbi:hypothetical protein ES703_09172 [subsurface metagenome]